MRRHAIGWEITIFLVASAFLGLAVVLGSQALLTGTLLAIAVATPIVLVSCLVRLAVGITGELRL